MLIRLNNIVLETNSINYSVDFLPIDGNNKIVVYTNCSDYNAGNTGGFPHPTFEGQAADCLREWLIASSFDLMKREWQ